MESKEILEKVLILNQKTKNYIDFLSQNSFDLENKILCYISVEDGCSPQDLIEFFKIKKTNLAIICHNLIQKGFIEKQKNSIDARAITYSATKEGLEKINSLYTAFENAHKELSEKDKESIATMIDEIIKFLKI